LRQRCSASRDKSPMISKGSAACFSFLSARVEAVLVGASPQWLTDLTTRF